MRHSVRVRPLVTLICAVCTLVLPAAAWASKSSPVHVDPSSPVAKEYALPLATARGAPPESGQSGSLFGSGIKHSAASPTPTTTPAPAPVQTQTTPPVTTTTQAPRPPSQGSHVTSVTLPTLTEPPATPPANASAAPAAYKVLRPGSGSGVLWMVLAGILVVVLGSAGGVALRRRR
jgi:hypothetical protein